MDKRLWDIPSKLMTGGAVFLVLMVLTGFPGNRAISPSSGCPPLNATANCSFTGACSELYQIHDRHGLKWKTTSSAIRIPGVCGRSNCYAPASSPQGQYMYLSGTTDQRAIGLWTDLISPPVGVNKGCLYFLYHNNVCENQRASMNLRVSLRGATSKDVFLREYPCVDDSRWYWTRIPISKSVGRYRVAFSAKQHRNISQTVAVDHVIYSSQSCALEDHVNYTSGDCTFEDGQLCGYHQKLHTGASLKWLSVRKEMLPSHQSNSLAPGGNFVFLWGQQDKDRNEKSVVHIKSPKVKLAKTGCLSVTYYSGRYHKENDNITALVLYRLLPRRQHTNESNSQVLHKFPATLGEDWMKAYIPLPEGHYPIRFTARVKQPFGKALHDVIGIDDIEVHRKSCDDVRCEGITCAASSSSNRVTLCSQSSHGKCVGRGVKYKTCKCAVPYAGDECSLRLEVEPRPNTRRNYGK